MRFWILFRDVELGRNSDQNIIRLLSKIKLLVENDVAICPISESVFVELMKQSDSETRIATAELIDRLSLGVTFIIYHQRVSQELCNAIYTLADVDNLFPLEALVWTRLTSILGEMHPHQTPFDADEELAIQKSFYDHTWNISLTEIIKTLDFTSWPQDDWENIAVGLNAGNMQHSSAVKNFKKVCRNEFEGVLSLFEADIIELLEEVEKSGCSDIKNKFEKFLENEKFFEFAKSIPTLHISACCHAAVRWDKNRRLSGNDLLDFHHASAAIGYCSLFLTENPLRTLVRQRHLELISDFPCRVESSVLGALEALNVIDS